MPLWQRSVLDSTMNLHYINNDNYFTNSKSLNNSMHRGIPDGINISSKNGHLIAILSVIPPLPPKADTVHLGGKDIQHLRISENLIKFVYGESKILHEEKQVIKWKNYVRYLSDTEIKEKINADTAIIVSLPPLYEDYYMKPYPYCTVLILQKNERGCLPIYFLYDEEGRKDLKMHITEIASSFRYGEELPLLKELNNKEIVVLYAYPKQKRGSVIR